MSDELFKQLEKAANEKYELGRENLHDLISEEVISSVKYHIKNDLTDLERSLLVSLAADIIDLLEDNKLLMVTRMRNFKPKENLDE